MYDNEFSPDRIAKRNQWYREHIHKYLDSPYRREQEYGSYLKRFYEEQDMHPNGGYKEPMPYNLYFS